MNAQGCVEYDPGVGVDTVMWYNVDAEVIR
jgi:hypothetical protein